jgi:transposase
VEGASGEDRSEAACLHRRDLGQDQHDARPWPMPQRRTPHRQSALRAMANPHVPGGAALRRAHRALRHRRTDQWRELPRLCRASSRPALAPGDIVVMDNLGSHKGRAVRAAIRAAKAKLFFLPAYSPDLNPIEQAFAKMKTLLRKADARTIDETWRTIGALLDRFTPKECANYFRNAGYASA